MEGNLRRACSRHFFARRDDSKKTVRPFGGLNVEVCGDWWQLKPVRRLGFTSNPFLKNSEYVEQRAMDLFWRDTPDEFQYLFALTREMRCRDPWLSHMLHEDRAGCESWEVYCFTHGLPTRNVGSWMPGTAEPSCKNPSCFCLATIKWPEMLRRGCLWILRQNLECDVCKLERKRRCRVMLPGDTSERRHLETPFSNAPYVHPFNAPKYHAQQLRALNFAKSTSKQLLWTVAYDVPVTTEDASLSKEQLESMRERWRQLHDKQTVGMPGLFPLVHNLPVYFTATESREDGVFKNSRGVLVGWVLTDAERDRIAAMPETPEIVLRERPLLLLIKVATATSEMKDVYGRGVYALKPQVRVWSRDTAGNAKVRRVGFPIVPDFGGTAHAYCGSTLPASLGHLLSWDKKPDLESMIHAYIIKSRVREVDKLLLVEPYSPQLFRQGALPGPDLLMKVLRGTMTTAEAKQAWKEVENAQEQKPKDKWPFAMMLPCRGCTEKNKGKEVLKPLSAFTAKRTVHGLWEETISKGQDLMCGRCLSGTYGHVQRSKEQILCDICNRILRKKGFDQTGIDLWKSCSDNAVSCKRCAGETTKTRNFDFEVVFCNFCNTRWPENAFMDAMLEEWRLDHQMHLAKCARCIVREQEPRPTQVVLCRKCEKKKPVAEFSPILLRQWLMNCKTEHR